MTSRELEAKLQHAEDKWNAPNRSDYYLMQIAAEVRRVLSKSPGSIKTGQFKIKFEYVTQQPIKKDPMASHGYWLAIAGVDPDRAKRINEEVGLKDPE